MLFHWRVNNAIRVIRKEREGGKNGTIGFQGEESKGSNVVSKLQWADYLVIGVMLSISAGIGIYYRFTGGRQRTAEVKPLEN